MECSFMEEIDTKKLLTPISRRSTTGSLTDYIITPDQTLDTPQKSSEIITNIDVVQNESTQKAKKTSQTPKTLTMKSKFSAFGRIKKT